MIILLIALSFPENIHSANYYVINAEGKIYVEGKPLKTGDKITDETEIKFTSVRDKLYLLSPDKGNFLIQPINKQGDAVPNWITLLKNALPESKYYKTASRGEEKKFLLFSDLYDIMGFFRGKVTYLPGTAFSVSTDKIPLDENNYLRFEGNPDNSDKAAPGIQILPGGFRLTGADTSANTFPLKLYYIQAGGKKEIGTLELAIKSRAAVIRELSLFFNLPENRNQFTPVHIYYEQVLPYIREAYGNTHPEMILKIIREDLGKQVAVAE